MEPNSGELSYPEIVKIVVKKHPEMQYYIHQMKQQDIRSLYQQVQLEISPFIKKKNIEERQGQTLVNKTLVKNQSSKSIGQTPQNSKYVGMKKPTEVAQIRKKLKEKLPSLAQNIDKIGDDQILRIFKESLG